jgi:hypothetical protein
MTLRTLLLTLSVAGMSVSSALAQTASPTPEPKKTKTIYDKKCVHRVLEGYCLAAAAEKNLPDEAQRTPAGDGEVWTWTSEGHQETALVVGGQVKSVSREYRPASWESWERALAAMVQVHGPGIDHSTIPAAAADGAAKSASVIRGVAHAQRVWSQPGYWVDLSWSRKGGLQVTYSLTEPARLTDGPALGK